MSSPLLPGRTGEVLHTWYQRVQVPARVILAGAAVTAFVKVLGLDLEHAVFLGVGVVVGCIAVLALRGTGASTAWLPDDRRERDGSRLEVAALSWALLGRNGRVTEGALRRLRTVAEGRLNRHGLSLHRVEDHDAIAALLGPTPWAVLTTRAHMPGRREYEQCVRALEKADPQPLDPTRR